MFKELAIFITDIVLFEKVFSAGTIALVLKQTDNHFLVTWSDNSTRYTKNVLKTDVITVSISDFIQNFRAEIIEFATNKQEQLNLDLLELMLEADETARWREHDLTWEIHSSEVATGDCPCGAGVTVRTHPMPNQIDIGGSAVAINCGDER